MGDLFKELRRRNVFRVAALYAVVGWLVMQVAGVLETAIGLPAWADGFAFFVLLIGFPIALILAWAFEVAPEGMKRTAAGTEGENIKNKGRALDYVIVGGLALVVILIIVDRIETKNDAISTGVETSTDANNERDFVAPIVASQNSIAVLPFADFSATADQEYFADGIAEEILNVLSKAPELNVVGRTSSFQFRGQNEDLRTIGNRLGVANILEGSVRKSDNRVRVTAQLIRASDGFHLWSESYDRDPSDIFRIQEEIAVAIAQALETPLGIKFGTQRDNRTDNLKAYELYLQGLSLYAKRGDGLTEAVKNFEQSVALDPQFAAAWAALSVAYSVIPAWMEVYDGRSVRGLVVMRDAERAALRAIELDPGAASSHHAMGIVLQDRWQWVRAEDALLKALKIEPRSAVILEDYQEFLTNVGRWQDAAPIAQKMLEIDPLNAFYHSSVAYTQWDIGNYDQAIAAFNRSMEINPSVASVFLVDHVALRIESRGYDDAVAFLESCGRCDSERRAFVRRLVDQVFTSETKIQNFEHLAPWGEGYYFISRLGGANAVLNAMEQNAMNYGWITLSGNFLSGVEAVRSLPRYKQHVIDLALDVYWRERGWPSFCKPISDSDFECG